MAVFSACFSPVRHLLSADPLGACGFGIQGGTVAAQEGSGQPAWDDPGSVLPARTSLFAFLEGKGCALSRAMC